MKFLDLESKQRNKKEEALFKKIVALRKKSPTFAKYCNNQPILLAEFKTLFEIKTFQFILKKTKEDRATLKEISQFLRITGKGKYWHGQQIGR